MLLLAHMPFLSFACIASVTTQIYLSPNVVWCRESPSRWVDINRLYTPRTRSKNSFSTPQSKVLEFMEPPSKTWAGKMLLTRPPLPTVVFLSWRRSVPRARWKQKGLAVRNVEGKAHFQARYGKVSTSFGATGKVRYEMFHSLDYCTYKSIHILFILNPWGRKKQNTISLK